ncbi:MAG: 3-deoxy-D-manno-octulosonic acid transferase [Candidatus Zixiibacteriota bacterium]
MISLYRLVMHLVYTLSYPFLRYRTANGDALAAGRMGNAIPSGPIDIWMHASSAGESRVMSYLISFLLQQRPNLNVYMTTMTPAGQAIAEKLVGDKVAVGYFPLDVSSVMDRVLSNIKPSAIVIAETEIWPNLVALAHSQDIPVILVNGRMTEKALGRYMFARSLFSPLMKKYDRFFLKSNADQQRYLKLGACREQTEVTGDMKFDAPLLPCSEGRILELRSRLGCSERDFLLMAGSTRTGEDEILLDAYRRIELHSAEARLVLAPRHVERSDQVRRMLRDRSLDFATYPDNCSDASIILVDRLGLLNELYMAADLAFVGGTLMDIGGHNILEPVWAGTPVLFGPSLGNVEEAAEYIQAHQYGALVHSANDIASIVADLQQGKRTFATKTHEDVTNSPTATAGNYILEKLNHA